MVISLQVAERTLHRFRREGQLDQLRYYAKPFRKDALKRTRYKLLVELAFKRSEEKLIPLSHFNVASKNIFIQN